MEVSAPDLIVPGSADHDVYLSCESIASGLFRFRTRYLPRSDSVPGTYPSVPVPYPVPSPLPLPLLPLLVQEDSACGQSDQQERRDSDDPPDEGRPSVRWTRTR